MYPQFSLVAQSCPPLCDPMNHSTPGLPVHHQLPESTQTHVHWVSDAIQPSHPLSSPSPPAPNPSQHQGLFQWVNSSHEVALASYKRASLWPWYVWSMYHDGSEHSHVVRNCFPAHWHLAFFISFFFLIISEFVFNLSSQVLDVIIVIQNK